MRSTSPRARPWWVATGVALVLAAVVAKAVAIDSLRRTGVVAYFALQSVDASVGSRSERLRFSVVEAWVRRIHQVLPYDDRDLVRLHLNGSHLGRVVLDARRVASDAPPGAPDALPVRWMMRQGQAWLGTHDRAAVGPEHRSLAGAAFAEFRVDPVDGRALLVGLRGPDLQPLAADGGTGSQVRPSGGRASGR